jgi:hypothetical protein
MRSQRGSVARGLSVKVRFVNMHLLADVATFLCGRHLCYLSVRLGDEQVGQWSDVIDAAKRDSPEGSVTFSLEAEPVLPALLE